MFGHRFPPGLYAGRDRPGRRFPFHGKKINEASLNGAAYDRHRWPAWAIASDTAVHHHRTAPYPNPQASDLPLTPHPATLVAKKGRAR